MRSTTRAQRRSAFFTLPAEIGPAAAHEAESALRRSIRRTISAHYLPSACNGKADFCTPSQGSLSDSRSRMNAGAQGIDDGFGFRRLPGMIARQVSNDQVDINREHDVAAPPRRCSPPSLPRFLACPDRTATRRPQPAWPPGMARTASEAPVRRALDGQPSARPPAAFLTDRLGQDDLTLGRNSRRQLAGSHGIILGETKVSRLARQGAGEQPAGLSRLSC